MPVGSLELELICDDFFDKRNHQHKNFDWWLRYMRKLGSDKSPTQITNYQTGKIQRFIKDFSHANHNGSRGFYARYFLTEGIYQVSERYKINQVRHYIILSEEAKIREITQQEAEQWLREHSE